MNKYEQQARQQRTAALRSSMPLWTGGVALLVVLLLMVGFHYSLMQTNFFKIAAVTLAILLLILRQLMRRLRGKAPRAAQPDPKSTLKLN
jgi:cobalamin synthase